MSEKLTADKRLHPRCASCLAQAQCLLFSEIPVRVLSSIQAVVQVRRCRRADMIFREGEPTSGFFIVRSGWSKVFNIRPDGRKTVQAIAGPGHVLGLVEVLTGSRLQSSAQALEECEVEYVSVADFSQILATNPDLRIQLLEAAHRQIQNARKELVDFAAVRAAAP